MSTHQETGQKKLSTCHNMSQWKAGDLKETFTCSELWKIQEHDAPPDICFRHLRFYVKNVSAEIQMWVYPEKMDCPIENH